MIATDHEAAVQVGQFERKHASFAEVIDGVSVWRLLRAEVFGALRQSGLVAARPSRAQLLTTIPRATVQWVRAKGGHRFIGKTFNSALRYADERGRLDVYFDYLIDALPDGAKMSSITSGSFSTGGDAFRLPVFDDTPVFIVSAVLGRVLPATMHSSFQHLSALLGSELGLVEFTPESIRRKWSVFRWRVRLYRAVLRRLGARAVLIPDTGQFALVRAANEIGIPAVEMQHGIFNEDHPDALPSWALGGDTSTLLLPDALTVYGEYYAQQLSSTAVGKLGRVRPVGAPLIDLARRKRQAEFRPDPARPIVTFTSQGMGKVEVISFLREFLAGCQLPFSLILRLHPGYDRDPAEFETAFGDDARVVVQPANVPPWTHEQLALSDLHISVSSACHHDAISIGTPTAVLALPGHQVVSDLVDANLAPLIHSPAELVTLVQSRNWRPAPEAASRQMHQPGFAANMDALLRSLGTET